MGKKIILLANTEAIESNRHHFCTLVSVIAFLATHQLSFRGKIAAFESEDEKEMDFVFKSV